MNHRILFYYPLFFLLHPNFLTNQFLLWWSDLVSIIGLTPKLKKKRKNEIIKLGGREMRFFFPCFLSLKKDGNVLLLSYIHTLLSPPPFALLFPSWLGPCLFSLCGNSIYSAGSAPFPSQYYAAPALQGGIRVDHQRREKYNQGKRSRIYARREKEKGEIGSDVIIPCPVIIDLSFFFSFCFFFFFVTSLVGLYWELHRLFANDTGDHNITHTVYKELGPLPYQLAWNNPKTHRQFSRV